MVTCPFFVNLRTFFPIFIMGKTDIGKTTNAMSPNKGSITKAAIARAMRDTLSRINETTASVNTKETSPTSLVNQEIRLPVELRWKNEIERERICAVRY